MSTEKDPDESHEPGRSLFLRAESGLAHAVYGLILTMATLGELLEHEVSASASVAWLLGSGLVLLAAHLFSDLLARVAVSRDDPDWNEIVHLGYEDAAVTLGAVGAAAVMAFAAIAELDAERALAACAIGGLVALAALSAYATAHHRRSTQVMMSAGAAVLGAVIVLLENTI
jgi:hypothetical protein